MTWIHTGWEKQNFELSVVGKWAHESGNPFPDKFPGYSTGQFGPIEYLGQICFYCVRLQFGLCLVAFLDWFRAGSRLADWI